MMFFYQFRNRILISDVQYPQFNTIPEDEAKKTGETVYVLTSLDPAKSRRSFSISEPSLMFLKEEGVKLLKIDANYSCKLPQWLTAKIRSRKATSVNTGYPNWQEVLYHSFPDKWRINIAGLGDVGGMLLIGLKLLGGDHISKIGIWGRNKENLKRWEYEANQISVPCCNKTLPGVHMINEDEIFDCDMLVFCISVGVPEIGSAVKDVRMVQFEGNSQIISEFAREARQKSFKGIFAVVSDPVDLLCKTAFIASNTDRAGNLDYKGLAPEQIRGYGLGVMHARAAYYAAQSPRTSHYLEEGRAFGPHGEGLVIADSIENYSEEISLYLTEKARKANLDVRATGYKPYIAPALSSGSLSLIATMSGQWHYSATFIGGVYMGSLNRLNKSGTEIERLDLPEPLFQRIRNTYKNLGDIV